MESLQEQENWAPLTTPISPHKQSAKRHWGSHPYFTRRAWNVVQAYIQHYTQPGDLVLDPFGGGGVTLIESLVLRRRAIHLDISPLSIFIAQHLAESPVDLPALAAAFDSVDQQCAAAIQALYEASEAEIAARPIPGWYPTDPLPDNADVERVDQLFTRRNLMALVLLRQAIDTVVDPVSRGLLEFVFSSTLNKVNRTFSHPASRKATRGDSGIMRHYRYWVPPQPAELPVWDQFSQRFRRVYAAKVETNACIGDFWRPDTARVLQGSALQLTEFVPSHSVDYLLTDPPYGAHIAYLDLATMWTAWLRRPITDEARRQEMIVGGSLRKSVDAYADQMQQFFRQSRRVLKPGHPLTVIFAHKDLRYWSYLMDAALTSGFSLLAAVPQSSYQTSWHKRQHPGSVLAGEVFVTFVATAGAGPTAPPSRTALICGLVDRVRAVLQQAGGRADQDTVATAVVQWLLDRQWAPWIASWDIDWLTVLREAFRWDAETGSWALTAPITQSSR